MNPGPGNGDGRAERLGVAAALAAYVFWGLAPVYFKQIDAVPAMEIIAHRILWSIPMMAGFLWLRDRGNFWQRLKLPPRTLATLAVTGALVVFNWFIFVWAVTQGQILATSLGYFIGPLVNFLLGFLFLRERLTVIQTAGVLLAASGTAYLGWFLGTPPWISLALAFSFGLYGLIRKMLNVGPMVGLLWETLLLAAPALAVVAWWRESGELAFGSGGATQDVLLILAGLVTILPLVWFNVAARTLSLSALGFFQYIAPSISFLISVFYYGELFTLGHAVAFGCIWLALAAVSVESVMTRRHDLAKPALGGRKKEEVILVHGLWFGSWAMRSLAARLEKQGYAVRRFDYSSTAGSLDDHAGRLRDFAKESTANRLHFVGHSLGGLVTLRMLAESGALPPGRVVLLGSPLDGSIVARKSRRLPGAEVLLGEVQAALEKGYDRIPEDRESGMIAGSRALGLGWLLGGVSGPGDGTVAVRETRKAGLRDHLVLPVTHTGMLLSAAVAGQVAAFLDKGRFSA